MPFQRKGRKEREENKDFVLSLRPLRFKK